MLDFPKLVTARYGLSESWTLRVAEEHGAYATARRAFTSMQPQEIAAHVKDANIRGRGGAGFPAGVKWGFIPKDNRKPVYLVINADEGEPGTFKDRTIMELDPHALVEGCLITMRAIGAHVCYIYVRCELVKSIQRIETAIEDARQRGYVGKAPFGVGHPIDIWVHAGAGAYICGEETSLLNSLEGLRGEPRLKPPFPAIAGAFGCPTIVNNVETIAAVPDIVRMGGNEWAALSRLPKDGGSRLYGVSGLVKKPGVYEGPVGLSLRELIYDFGGGSATGRPVRAVQVGGPLGQYLPTAKFDTPLDYEAFAAAGGMVGHGGVVVFDDTVDMAWMARYAMEFCAIESCGKCTPCRIGSVRGVEVIDKLRHPQAQRRAQNLELLRDLCDTMTNASLCAMGGLTPGPVLSAVESFPEDFGLPRPAADKAPR